MKKFTNNFQLSKTLRFELKPIGKTLENIEKKGLIKKDMQRAESYQEMKKTIDEFHKYFIDLALSNKKLSNLQDYLSLYNQSTETKKEEAFKIAFKKVQELLRKEIVSSFSEGEAKSIFSILDKKELITIELEKWKNENHLEVHLDEGFKTFTTYFTGFHQNRKNMYSTEANSTAIAYRLIHENLPKFIENQKIFEKIITIDALKPKIQKIYSDFEAYLNVNELKELFELDYFNEVLTQKGITVYNYIIGGRAENDGKQKIQGLNEIINLYNQTKNKNERLPKFKQLYKQILSDRISLSFLPEAFTDGKEVLKAVFDFYKVNLLSYTQEGINESQNLLELIYTTLKGLNTHDLNKIYLKNDTSLTTISQQLFDDFSVFSTALQYHYETIINPNYLKEYQKANEKKQEKLDKEKDKFTKQEYFSIAFLQETLSNYIETLDETATWRQNYKSDLLVSYFSNHFIAKKEQETDKTFDFISNITAKYQCIQGILENADNYEEELKQDQKLIDNLKFFLDAILEVLHFIKPLHLKSDSVTEKDTTFYDVFETYYEALSLVTSLYNMVRNYVTQKPYSTKKIKLNFENAQLLNGWDANKEADYLTTILRKNGHYFLAIMDKKHNKIFQNLTQNNDDNYEKMVYKLLPGVNKMLPKVFFSNKNIDFFNPSDEILSNYKNDTHKKGNTFNLKDCHCLIDFFKESLHKHEDWKNFNFRFSDTYTYTDLSGFYREVEHQGYKIDFKNVGATQINDLVEEGKMYLFQIYNKDFSPYSKGKPNLHTLYWKALFEEENLKNVVYKLNGQAEVFFREASIKKNLITHKANQPIASKNPLTPAAQNTFTYDLVKDKRYTVDKFQFHVPITLNFKATGGSYINQNVLEYLKNNPNVKIIGLDRGERHLVYLTLIDQEGKIHLQESLNIIRDEKKDTPYHTLLHNKEVAREKARKNWGSIESIKELKEGYISQVVHKITQLMVTHNAIVVMEDLNFGFKRGRFKVEKQIYQKLEKMLIDKLNYLVLKNKQPKELGGIYNALQLTNKFESFQKIGKQSGFLFYVPAWNTSKIDPTTGFVNYFYTKYENIEKAKIFFNKFDSIRYNKAKAYFEFVVTKYSDFNAKAAETKQDWVICSYGDRIETKREKEQNNHFVSHSIAITEKLQTFFDKNSLDCTSELKTQILMQNEKSFFEELLYLFKLVLQMRNSEIQTEVDYLISPVANEKGIFYDSRKASAELPNNADANGAYHIAKKGLWILEQINKTKTSDDLKKIKLAISNREWLQYVQQNKSK